MLEDTLVPEGFFAYPSKPPMIGEAIRLAITNINKTQTVKLSSWEEMRVGGKLIVDEICSQIEGKELFCADLTGLNPNVMFELGFAIAKERRVWLSMDSSVVDAKAHFDRLKILTTVGIAGCRNSDELVDQFFKDHPHTELAATIFNRAIAPMLDDNMTEAFLYLKNRNPTEASNQISKLVASSKAPVIVDDPSETASQAISWYGKHVYRSLGVICHLSSASREGATLHNAKCSLVAGMAFGMKKRLLILSEEQGQLAPMDYRDLLREYRSAQDAQKHLVEWITPLQQAWEMRKSAKTDYIAKRKLAQGLKEFHFGEYIAENEATELDTYFVETAAYKDALAGRHKIFVGRKGTGKTANFTKLAQEFRKGHKNLVCVIKPVAYELESVVRLLHKHAGDEMQGYVIESLWKFLLFSEIAIATYQEQTTGGGKISQPFIDFMDKNADILMAEFSVRLEKCVHKLLKETGEATDIEKQRYQIASALHSGVLHDLRTHLGECLSSKDRISILVDNLDKAWEKDRNLTELSHFFLGLLGAAGRVEKDFRKADSRFKAVNVNMIIFLRADIFFNVQRVAREPDKIGHTRMSWEDKEILFRVIEERFVQSHAEQVTPSELWQTYFCDTAENRPTRDFIFESILPRPRDLVFFVSSAVTTAINRGHGRVENADLKQAQKLYSQYAIDSIGVEYGGTATAFEKIVFEFAGSDSVMPESEIRKRLAAAGVEEQMFSNTIEELCLLSFFQVETAADEFRLADNPQDLQKKLVLAKRITEGSKGPRRFRIHPAFWPFLEITNYGAN